MNYWKITYYHTLCGRYVTNNICGPVEFHYTDHSYVTFSSGGHGYMVDAKYIKEIAPIDD